MATGDVKLTFGKHKGECLCDVPVTYLDWLLGQEWLFDDLREKIKDHLTHRPEWKNMAVEDV